MKDLLYKRRMERQLAAARGELQGDKPPEEVRNSPYRINGDCSVTPGSAELNSRPPAAIILPATVTNLLAFMLLASTETTEYM